ncbi:MAG: aldehyde dehydrogenase family protein [archaeon]|nr:aldehyde dehydrogenase family protein [archaeon]
METTPLNTKNLDKIEMNIPYDNAESCRTKINHLREVLKQRKMTSIPYRKKHLEKLLELWNKYESEIQLSNYLDLGQSEFVSKYTTYYQVRNEIKYAIKNLDKWVKPISEDTPLSFPLGRSYVYPEPFGVVLIFSAWNCNFLTLIVPLVQAIAAGNLVLCKPAASAVETCKVCMKILNEMDKEVVECCAGKEDVREELLNNQFDLIMFTGSSKIGKIIHQAAAKFLTPTILELGGQNPVIVEKTANIKTAAYNICYGRMAINGQACIAPEYILCDRSLYDSLVKEIISVFKEFFGPDPLKSEFLGRIINTRHCQRIYDIISNPGKGAKLLYGDISKCSVEDRLILPTFFGFDNLDDCNKSELAKGEIFGAVLFIAPYDNIEDALTYIANRPKPLAGYAFTSDSKMKEYLTANTTSGNFVINDTIIHFTSSYIPFGGVGNSGMGNYHGYWGFKSFSHWKGIIDNNNLIIPVRYPPFDKTKKFLFTKFLNEMNFGRNALVKGIIEIILGLAVAIYLLKMLKGQKN